MWTFERQKCCVDALRPRDGWRHGGAIREMREVQLCAAVEVQGRHQRTALAHRLLQVTCSSTQDNRPSRICVGSRGSKLPSSVKSDVANVIVRWCAKDIRLVISYHYFSKRLFPSVLAISISQSYAQATELKQQTVKTLNFEGLPITLTQIVHSWQIP